MSWPTKPVLGGPPVRARLFGPFLLLVFHSVGRHKALFFLIWFGIVALSLLSMALLPKTYEVHTILEAKSAQFVPALGSQVTLGQADSPTRQASEAVLSHDNLVALVRETDLIRRSTLHRAPLARLKAAIFRWLFHPPNEKDQIEDFVTLLEDRLSVTTKDETVTIAISFPDAELAYHLVETALENFVEARHAAVTSSISEAISILETRTTQAKDKLDEDRRTLQELRAARAPKAAKPPRVTRLPTETDPDTTQLLARIQTKRQAILDFEELRQRRVTELETRLGEQRAIYSEAHPVVRDLRQSLEAMRQESPQLLALRQELALLVAELQQRGLSAETQLKSPTAVAVVQAVAQELDEASESQDPDLEYAKAQVRESLARYSGLLNRIGGARLEQDTAQAAYKYQYTVIWPAQLPRHPAKPRPEMVTVSSLLAGLLVALIGVALLDRASHTAIEPWQVERATGVPLLGKIRISS